MNYQMNDMKFCLVIVMLTLVCISCERGSQRGRRQLTLENSRRNSSVPTNRKAQESRIEKGEQVVGGALKPTEIFERCNAAVFMIYTSNEYSAMQGSGFFISPQGIAVSNYHVFKGTSRGAEAIKLSDGSEYKIKEVLAYSVENDYIVFQVDAERRFTFLPICKRKSKVGETVYAIGSPKGYENTFSSGEISQIRENNIIQISVPIDHGSSGGALLNSFGEVIGITSGGCDDSGANLNYAIDIEVVRTGMN